MLAFFMIIKVSRKINNFFFKCSVRTPCWSCAVFRQSCNLQIINKSRNIFRRSISVEFVTKNRWVLGLRQKYLSVSDLFKTMAKIVRCWGTADPGRADIKIIYLQNHGIDTISTK